MINPKGLRVDWKGSRASWKVRGSADKFYRLAEGWKIFFFLVATKRLYKRMCPSVGPSVGPSLRPSVG